MGFLPVSVGYLRYRYWYQSALFIGIVLAVALVPVVAIGGYCLWRCITRKTRQLYFGHKPMVTLSFQFLLVLKAGWHTHLKKFNGTTHITGFLYEICYRNYYRKSTLCVANLVQSVFAKNNIFKGTIKRPYLDSFLRSAYRLLQVVSVLCYTEFGVAQKH